MTTNKYFFPAAMLILTLAMVLISTPAQPAGKVYLVLGSDTAIWDGMDTRSFHCTYQQDLYTDPAGNTFRVMAPDFRNQIRDSYGTPLKLTWWMMAGNIFRYATNNNFPVANIMTLYLMKKYHEAAIAQFGDELSLHYHTFTWTDYDGDGLYWWNQAKNFTECQDDFDWTLAQFLLEENVFPVSFRSGWHYMDNDWQQTLDQILPYSMHNDWPAKRVDTTEPLDNTYDWSHAPQEFVPFHPAPENYQVPGAGPGWNVRSIYMASMSQSLMDHVFAQANNGIDQVACIWAHLPETDFLDNIQRIDRIAQAAAARFPAVQFRYCTAIEAMQRWRQAGEALAPHLVFSAETVGEMVRLVIETDAPIFQPRPFVAVKDLYQQYYRLSTIALGPNRWQTRELLPKARLAKAGVAVTDTLGNLATQFIHFLPDDIFIDNQDAGYQEFSGVWFSASSAAWGTDSRYALLAAQDSAAVRWRPALSASGRYNLFVQVPAVDNPAQQIEFRMVSNQQVVHRLAVNNGLPTREWFYLGTVELSQSADNYLEMIASGAGQAGKKLAADGCKFSALVRERDLQVNRDFLDFGLVSELDTAYYRLQVQNRGIAELKIFGVSSASGAITSAQSFPIRIAGMAAGELVLRLCPEKIGIWADTLIIHSDDPVKPDYRIPVSADVQYYFAAVDNEDALHYREFGAWHYSNAQAWGPSSRYAYLGQSPKPYAVFFTRLKKTGIYELFEIVPTTVNAANQALYQLVVAEVLVDSLYLDQNAGSGNWVSLGQYHLPADAAIEVRVLDTGKSTAGLVLRADAIKFLLIQETGLADDCSRQMPQSFELWQNYPNPFNASTTIGYVLPSAQRVMVQIYNLQGELVRTLVSADRSAGFHSSPWDGTDDLGRTVASGIYIYRLQAGPFSQTRRMVLLK